MKYDDITICNLAMDHLEEKPITDLSARDAASTRCARNYPLARDFVTGDFAWTCAVRRRTLTAVSDVPPFGWQRQFTIPVDCLRVLPLTDTGMRDGRPVPYEVEGRIILTNAQAPLKVRYIRQLTNAAEIDDQLAMAISLYLGFLLAKPVTGSDSKRQEMLALYERFKRDARMVDSKRSQLDDIIPREDP